MWIILVLLQIKHGFYFRLKMCENLCWVDGVICLWDIINAKMTWGKRKIIWIVEVNFVGWTMQYVTDIGSALKSVLKGITLETVQSPTFWSHLLVN